jgi:hypothetical protein
VRKPTKSSPLKTKATTPANDMAVEGPGSRRQ